MTSYNAVLTLARWHNGDALSSEVLGSELGAYNVACDPDELLRARITITIEAVDLAQAMTTARVLFAPWPDQVRLDVMTVQEFQRGVRTIPELISVTEAAERLGVTRQAVLQRLWSGSIPARKVGQTWVILAQSTRTGSNGHGSERQVGADASGAETGAD